jgi:hypothetical protein
MKKVQLNRSVKRSETAEVSTKFLNSATILAWSISQEEFIGKFRILVSYCCEKGFEIEIGVRNFLANVF